MYQLLLEVICVTEKPTRGVLQICVIVFLDTLIEILTIFF